MPAIPPGAQPVDPSIEAWRLAKARMQAPEPPAREWAVKHPGGFVSIGVTGMPFRSRQSADEVRIECDHACVWCAGKQQQPHILVWRDRPEWREDGSDDGNADYSSAAQ